MTRSVVVLGPYPVASNQRGDHPRTPDSDGPARCTARSAPDGFFPDAGGLREEIHRLILEELAQLAGG